MSILSLSPFILAAALQIFQEIDKNAIPDKRKKLVKGIKIVLIVAGCIVNVLIYFNKPPEPKTVTQKGPGTDTIRKTDTVIVTKTDTDPAPIVALAPSGVRRLNNDTMIISFNFRVLNNTYVKKVQTETIGIPVKNGVFGQKHIILSHLDDIINNSGAENIVSHASGVKRTDSIVIIVRVSYEPLHSSKRVKFGPKIFVLNDDAIWGCSTKLEDSLKKHSLF